MTNRFWRLAGIMLVALMGAGAWAAPTPVAIWDGDNTDLGNFTLTADNGNTIGADHSIAIEDGATGGVVYTGDNSSLNNSTFIIRGSGLDLSNAGNQYLLTLHQNILGGGNGDASYNKVGASLAANNAAVRGIWENAFYGNNNMQVADPFSSGTDIVINIQTSGGVFVYEIVTDAETGARSLVKRYGNVNLKASNTNYKGFSLGGIYEKASSTLSPATGWTISKMAVFGSTLSESEILGYEFPSDLTIPVNENTSVSALNDLIAAASGAKVIFYVADGVEIDVDAAFVASVPVEVASSGTITLSAASQPAASYFTNVSFGGVKGALLRSWLTPGVVGFNFRSANGTDVSGALATADNWIHDNNSASGTSTAMFADDLSTLTWSSGGTYSFSGSTILCGYLDDSANGGNGAEVTLSNVPYETYDVIVYCSSDSNPGQFLAKTVNGTTYTWDTAAGAVVAGNAAWGKAALSTPVYGVNALRIKNLAGPLTIYGGARNGSNRGGIAAFEIMPPETPDNIPTYVLTLSGTATTWSGGAWTLNSQTVDAPTSGYVEIVASASTTLTVDQAVNLADLKVRGGENIVVNVSTNSTGSLYAIKATVASGVFQQGSPAVLGTTPSIVVANGATFDENGMAVNAANAVTIAGAGAGNWPWALTSSSSAGGAILGGLYLSANATIGGENELKVGQTQAGYQCYLQGFTLTKTGAGAFTGTNMNTPGTGTIEVQGGAMSVNQWSNLNSASGDTTVILNSGTSLANGTDRIVPMSALGLYGGTLSTASRAFKVKTAFRGAGETANLAFGDGASASLTGDLTVTATMTLDGSMTFLKDAEAASDVVVAPATLAASTGTITVGSGVTFNVGTSRPTATITVQNGGTLAAQLQSVSDVIALSTSAKPANVILYDANGDVVSNARISYSDGTLTIMPPVPTLPASGTVAFDTATNWEDEAMPSNDGDAIIELADDATITVSGTYTLGSLTITGSGVVTFSGEGTITAVNISVKNGATFTRNANISATTGISIDAGTVLRLDGVTENAAISGAGAVETYGVVVLASVNSMTGGITVKSGSSLSTSVAPVWENVSTKAKCNTGFGPYNKDSAYSAQSRVVVEDGGCVDINNIANKDTGVALTIAGKGILNAGVYSGAVKYSGSGAIGNNSRQISSLSLTADAMIDIGQGCGLVHSGYSAAYLNLAGHSLTMRGTGTVPMVNVTATAGNLVLEGATLELSNAASNLNGVNVVAKGCATINVATAPSALGSLTLKPSAAGTTAANWNLPEGLVPALDTSNVDPAGLSVGDELTLFTAPSATELTAATISVKAGGRYTTTISGNTVTATVKAPTNFLHYDFNNGAAVNTGAADDSGTTISSVGEGGSVTLVDSKNGKAVQVHTGYTPYWDTFANGTSPFHADEVTVTTMAQLKETGIVLWGLGGAAANLAMGLVVTDAHTAKVVARKGSAEVVTLATATVEQDLTSGWHFFAVVSDENGTKLYVDNNDPASTNESIPAGIGQAGQLGSFHGGAFGASKVGADGYLLDDWRVYDAALTAAEVEDIRNELPTITIDITHIDNASVTAITVNGESVDIADSITVVVGATVSVAYTAAEGYFITGSPVTFTVTATTTAVDPSSIEFVDGATVLNADTGNAYESLQDAINDGSGTLTLKMIGASSSAATIPDGITVVLVDDNHFFTGNITVAEGGTLDISNREAGDCVACAKLTLETDSTVVLPNGVALPVTVASDSVTASVRVYVCIGDSAAAAYFIDSTANGVLRRTVRATVKPIAVWNGDFPLATDGTDTRGGFTVEMKGNSNLNGNVLLADSDNPGLGVFKYSGTALANASTPFAAVFNVSNITTSGSRMLATAYANSVNNRVMVGMSGTNYTAWHSGGSGYNQGYQTKESWSGNAADLYSMGFVYNPGDTYGSYLYCDGSLVLQANGLKWPGDAGKVAGVSLGGCHGTESRWNFPGAVISYVAILNTSDPADVAIWSLKHMTTAETVAAEGGSLAGGDRSNCGINLNGGVVSVSESATVAALFVQDDTTLSFAPGATLNVEGPLYVADGVQLKVVCQELGNDPVAAITAGTLAFADNQLESGDLWQGVYINYNQICCTHLTQYEGTVIDNEIQWNGSGPTDEQLASGFVILDGSGEASLPVAPGVLSLGAGVTVDVTGFSTTTLLGEGTFRYTANYPANVPEGFTYEYVGGTDESDEVVISDAIKIYGVLRTKGYFDFASTANDIYVGGTLEVVDGQTKMDTYNTNYSGGFAGTITIDPKGTFVNKRTDTLKRNGDLVTINVYGTLSGGSTRWSVQGSTRHIINLYPDAKIVGNGDGNGFWDFDGDGGKINVWGVDRNGNAVVDGSATISAPIRLRTGGTTTSIWIADNTTLVLDNSVFGSGNLRKTGPGTMAMQGTVTTSGSVNATEGTLRIEAPLESIIAVDDSGTLDVSKLDGAATSKTVALANLATVVVPENANLETGVQLTTLEDENSLTAGACATIVKGENVYTNASVKVVDNNKLAMVAQTTHAATITGDTDWANIVWSPTLPADPTGRKLIINASAGAVIDGGELAKTAGSIVFNVAQDSILTITNLTLTANLITVNGGAVKVYSADTLTGTFVGNGTVIYDGAMPASPADKFTNTNWRGTLHLKDLNTNTQRNLVLNSYGNTQSTIKLEGVNGYFAATVTVNPVIELAGNGLDINNGNSGTVVTMPVLKGNGTLTVSGGSSSGNGLVIRDCSGWTGSLDMTRSDRYRITFGASGTAGADGKVIIAASRSVTIADGVTWTTVGGIENNGNLAVEPLGVISGPLVNNGTITLSGTLSGAVNNDNGTITVTGADANLGHLRDLGNVVLSSAAGTNTVTVWQSNYEYLTGEAQVTNIADPAIEYVVLMMISGEDATAPTPRDNGGTADTVTFTLDVHVDDDASWYSFPFNEAYYNSMLTNPAAMMYLPNKGYATGQLQLNKVDNHQYKVADSFDVDSQLLMYASPFFSPKYPENFSVALSATLPATANNVLMSCGNSGGYLALIRGEADDEVLLVEGNNEYQTTIAKMRAFNADKVNHLYVFAKEGNKITVYLDGAEVISKQLRDGFTIGNGFQIGQLFGGNLHGSTGVAVTDANAKVRLFRIYEIAMTQRMIDKLSEEYPVVLPDVRSVLTLNDANQITYWYDKEGRWEQSGYEAGTDTGGDFDRLPQPNAKVTLINETSAQTLKVNLNRTTRNADSFIYSLTVQGTKELAIGKPMGGHCVYVSTVISNEAPLTVTYGALDMLNARLEMTETATLTFDLTDYLKSLDGVAGSYPLTGKCQKFGDGQVTITYDPSKVIYSRVELKYDTLLQQYCVELGIRDNATVYLVPNSNPITLALGQEVRDGDGNPTLLLEGDTLEIAEATPGAGMVILEADIGIPKFVIPADATLEVTYEGFTNAVAGAGRIRFKGRPKAATHDSFQIPGKWTGLVEMIGIDFDNTGLDNYVNASSTLRLIGCTAFPAAGHDDDIAVVLKDTDEDEARDYGYGLLVKGISGSGDDQWVTLTALLGDGALVCTNTAAAVKHLRIRDTSGFTGNLYNQVGETGGVGLVLGATATDPGDGSCLEVQADAVLNLVDLVHAETNLVVIGTNNVTRAGALVDCPETIFDGGTLRIGAPGAYPVFLGKVSGTALQLELADGLGTATRTIMGARDRNDLPEASLIQLPDGYALSTLTEDIDDGDNQFHTEYYYVITRPGFYIRIR